MRSLAVYSLFISSTCILTSNAQLSGDDLVCPDSMGEVTCNVSGGVVTWSVESPQIQPALFRSFTISSTNLLPLGIPVPFAGSSTPGVTATVHSISNTSVSSSVSVDTAIQDLTSGPITVTCEYASTTASSIIGLLDPPSIVMFSCDYVESEDDDSSLVTLLWSPSLSDDIAPVDNYTLTIIPSPPSLTPPLTTTNTTATLTLFNSVMYDVTITATNCAGCNSTSYNLTVFSQCMNGTGNSGDGTSTTTGPTTTMCTSGTAPQKGMCSTGSNSTTPPGESFGQAWLIPVIVGVFVLLAIGVMFAAICLVVISKRKLAKSKSETNSTNRISLVETDAEYNHIRFQSSKPNQDEEYSTINRPPAGAVKSKAQVQDDYEYCTVTSKNRSPLSESYARLGANSAKKVGASSSKEEDSPATQRETCFKTGQNVEYAVVAIKTKPEDQLLNLDAMLIQLRGVASKWKEIAAELGIPRRNLSSIKETTSGEDFDCLVEVCDQWIKKLYDKHSQPTWRAVGKTLSRVGCHELSKEILAIYDTGELPDREVVADVSITAEPNYDDVIATNKASKGPALQYDDVVVNQVDSAPPLPPKLFDVSN